MGATACSYEIGLTAAEMAGKDTAKMGKAVDDKHEHRQKQSVWDEELQKGSKVQRARMNARRLGIGHEPALETDQCE
jgi:hypothetical protein